MKNTDIQIDATYDLKADPDGHDLTVGDVTLQNQALILKTQQGEWKEHPMVGCGTDDMPNDENPHRWHRLIREQLQRDGMTVRSLKINQDNIETDAEYEND